jgi:hypothetical protein
MAEKSGSKPTSKKGTTSRPGGRKSSKKTKGASKNDAISTETKPSIVQSSITDYFSVRRSGRRCQSDVEVSQPLMIGWMDGCVIEREE